MVYRDTFTFRSGSDGGHLWVVASDPDQNATRVLIVNFTTVRGVRFEDLSCVVEPGEHPRFTKPSYVAFARARLHTLAYLDGLEVSKTIKLDDPLSPAIMSQVHAGAAISTNLPFAFLAVLEAQGFVPPDASWPSAAPL